MTGTNRHSAFISEMGLGPVWKLRERDDGSAISADQNEISPIKMLPQVDFAEVPMAEESFSFDAPPAFFDDIPWEEGVSTPSQEAGPNVADMDWEELEATMLQCTACGLCEQRTKVVPGVGDRKADWLFIGEGPGYYEDQQGEPFVGASGKLLDNMLRAMHKKRGDDVYIANIVKCRPTDTGGKDRPPSFEEAKACRPFLDRQIALIQPKIIVALGRTAVTMILGTDSQTSLASMRGQVHQYRGSGGNAIPLIATYHPAYLLRQLPDKKKAWGDLCMGMHEMATHF